ncbi:MAG: tetratricopeptide repeat protein [Deltaproteobacteria bacterium]|nr:tetratricopeptide repeat protein [Deltaproteobacteria bacterium]
MLLTLGVLLLAVFPLVGCDTQGGGAQLLHKARLQWEEGHFEDAARSYIGLAELYPDAPEAEDALFWAANLYQYYLVQSEPATRLYQQLVVRFPQGRFFLEAKQNMAQLFEESPESRPRALQIYQQLVLNPALQEQHDAFLIKIGLLYMELGKMDQARQALRDLLVNYPASAMRGDAFYLTGYSYYLEGRIDMALAAFTRTAKEFAGTPLAVRAQFFIADTLEEKGDMKSALTAFIALQGKYPQPTILERRIKTLEARIRRGVR